MLGCCIPCDASKRTNKMINKALERDRKEMNREAKILIFGAKESGKSTVIKQIKRIFNENGYTTEECLHFKPIVFLNTIQSMLAILRAMDRLQIPFENANRQTDAKIVLVHTQLESNHEILPVTVGTAMQALWNDNGIQACFLRVREYRLSDSAAYYLNSLNRLIRPDYIPTQQDVLRARVKTTAFVETVFTLKKHKFRIVDINGQGGKQRKWIDFLEGVTAVIFVSALNEYDLVVSEDDRRNRMIESLALFRSICFSRLFHQAGMILFLNKKDLFAEKLRFSPINNCFPDYTGPNTYESSIHYIQEQFKKMDFREKINGREPELYIHVTCAIDTEAMQFVFVAISEMIIKTNLIHAQMF